MFLTLQNVKSGIPIFLHHPIDNTNNNLKIILHEILYTVKWVNISEDMGTDHIILKPHNSPEKRHSIPDGYYDFCRLSEDLFKPLGIEAELNPVNLIVKLTLIKEKHNNLALQFSEKLAAILGFSSEKFAFKFSENENKKTILGSKPLNLAVNKRIYFYCHQLNTSENLVDGQPSNLLKIVSVNRESYCDPVTYTFQQQKRPLSHDYLSAICFKIINQDGEVVDFEDLTIVLEIVN